MSGPHTQNWDETAPADTQLANVLGDSDRDIKRDTRERASYDHYWPSGANDGGEHQRVTLRNETLRAGTPPDDPVAQADCAILYAKNAAGTTELFLRDEAGNIIQLTTGGKLRSDALSVSAAALVLLANNVALKSKEAGGTERSLLLITAADEIEIGGGVNLLRLKSGTAENLKIKPGAGADQTIFHAGNAVPTISEDTVSADYSFAGAWAQATGLGDLSFVAPADGSWIVDIRLYGTLLFNAASTGQMRISEKIDAGAFAQIAIATLGNYERNGEYHGFYIGRRRTTVAGSTYTYRFEFQLTAGSSVSVDVSEGGVYGFLAAHRTG